MRKNYLLIALLIACGFAVYSFALGAPFKTMDDAISIVDNPHIRSFSHLPRIFTTAFFGDRSYYRPLIALSFMLEYSFFGLNSFVYYLTNIFLHLANGVVVFILLNRFFADRRIAWLSALLFVIHPIQGEAVINIPGRSNLLCAFFVLNAFGQYLLYEQKKKLSHYIAALSFFMLGLLSKESAVVFPLVLACYEYFFVRGSQEGKRENYRRVIPFFMTVVVYLAWRQYLGITERFTWPTLAYQMLGVLTFLRGLFTYARLFIFPFDLHFDRSREMFSSFADFELIGTAVFFLIGLGFIIFFRKRIPAWTKFFIGWFFIHLLTVAQIFASVGVQPGAISLAEHFLYLPSLGIFTLLSAWLIRLWSDAKARVFPEVLIVGFLGVLVVFNVHHNRITQSEEDMLKRSLAFNPKNARIQNALALYYVKLRRFSEAQSHFEKVVELDPLNPRGRISLGKCLIDQGRLVEGIREYEKVTDPGEFKGLYESNIDLAYKLLSKRYQDILTREPENAQAHYSLGVAWSKMNRMDEAMAEYQKALTLRPDYKNALFNLATMHALKGETALAIETFEKVIALSGSEDELNTRARQSLSLLYKTSGNLEKSEKFLKEAQNYEIMKRLE